jgi:hypothetical protein
MKESRSKLGAGFGAVILGAVLVVLAAGPIGLPKAESASSRFLSTVNVPGVSSDVNNVEFAFNGRYSVVAPFETSDPVNQDPFFGDNHYLVITDLNNPSNTIRLDLTGIGEAATSCYYPSHLIVSSNNIAFVRATESNPVTHQPVDECIAYGQLSLDRDTGAISFSSFITVKIPNVTGDPGAVPIDFGVSKAGEFLVFTNGYQVSTVELSTGNSYALQPVPDAQYAPLPDPSSPNSSTSDYQAITKLDVDPNNMIGVTVNGRVSGGDFSRLFFYRLREGVKRPGTMDLLAPPVESSQLHGSQISPGSVSAVSADCSLGYFVTTDGSLWSVPLNGSRSLAPSKLGNYLSISGPAGYQAEPRSVRIDPSGKTLSIARQGATMFIRRPTYGKHRGGIRRPTYAKYDESPGLVLVYLNQNGSVAGDLEIPSQGLGNGVYAISCPAFTEDGGAYVAASFFGSQGALKLFGKSGPPADIGGAIPNNVGQIASPDGLTLVGIQDFDLTQNSPDPRTGSLVFLSLEHGAYDVAVASSKAAIRRPCNVNH